MDGQGSGSHAFRSPPRVLAGFFQKSRDRWKQKCLHVKTELKRVKVRVADVSKSRDAWRNKAEDKQRQLEALQAQLQELQDQVSQEYLHQAGSPGAAADQKKR
jgi:uncharacterized protein YdaU (DUF1376 family)